MNDESPLTRRESQILEIMAEGLSNDEIAQRLTISPNTVKVHVRNIFEKMGVQSRTEATMEAVRRGWIDIPGLDSLDDTPVEDKGWSSLSREWRSWQTILLATAMLLAILVALWPNLGSSTEALDVADFTTDQGLQQLTPQRRMDVARWAQRAPMPTGRSRAASAVIAGELYVIGGETATGDTDVMEVYEPPPVDAWRSLVPRPIAARNAAASALADQLYVTGGCTDSSVTPLAHRYNPEDQTWTAVAPLPEPRCGHGMVALGGRLYVIGGWDGSEVQDTLFIYDPSLDQWEEGRRLPAPRAFLGIAAFQDEILVVGGHDGVQQRADAWQYHPDSDGWSPAPALPAPRAGIAVASEGNSIYVIGGGEGQQEPLHDRYDRLTQVWSTLDFPREGTWRHATTQAVGPNLYVIGGWSGEYLNVVEAYQASHLLFLPLGQQQAK